MKRLLGGGKAVEYLAWQKKQKSVLVFGTHAMANAGKLEFQESQGHENKVLPQGIHLFTEDEFHYFFCAAFPASKTRPRIDGRYTDFRRFIAEYLPSVHLVYGPYIEEVKNPTTMEVIVWVSDKGYQALSEVRKNRLLQMCQVPSRYGEKFYKINPIIATFSHPEDLNGGLHKYSKKRLLNTTSSGTLRGLAALKMILITSGRVQSANTSKN